MHAVKGLDSSSANELTSLTLAALEHRTPVVFTGCHHLGSLKLATHGSELHEIRTCADLTRIASEFHCFETSAVFAIDSSLRAIDMCEFILISETIRVHPESLAGKSEDLKLLDVFFQKGHCHVRQYIKAGDVVELVGFFILLKGALACQAEMYVGMEAVIMEPRIYRSFRSIDSDYCFINGEDRFRFRALEDSSIIVLPSLQQLEVLEPKLLNSLWHTMITQKVLREHEMSMKALLQHHTGFFRSKSANQLITRYASITSLETGLERKASGLGCILRHAAVIQNKSQELQNMQEGECGSAIPGLTHCVAKPVEHSL